MAYLSRDILSSVLQFMNSPKASGSRIAVLSGPPCIGKSTLLKMIAEQKGTGYILADLTTDRELYSVVSDALNKSADSLFNELCGFFGLNGSVLSKTLLLLDGLEILGVKASKLLTVKLPEACVLATDNNIILASDSGLETQFNISVRIFRVHTMSFSEFLAATGRGEYRDIIRAKVRENKPVPDILKEVMEEEYWNYLLVGGYPQAVIQFNNNRNDISGIRNIHRQIFSTIVQSIYEAVSCDFVNIRTARIEQILNYSRTNSEMLPVFRPGTIRRGLTNSDFNDEMQYLIGYGLLVPTASDFNTGYVIADNGLQRYIANDYDVFYRADQETLPSHIMLQGMYVACSTNDMKAVYTSNRRGTEIALCINDINVCFITGGRRRKSTVKQDISTTKEESDFYTIINYTESRKSGDHSILWYELDETLKWKKSQI